MHEIEINRPGLIVAGEQTGWNVFIQDDSLNTGGYLILVTPPVESNNLTGYDNWVEDFSSLQGYFQEANWKIRWLDKHASGRTPNQV